MKRAAALLALALVPASALGEDSFSLFGSYYKERSTRVVSPLARLKKSLPSEAEVEAWWAVDQITSASGAFTTTDTPFQEYRNEIRVAGSVELFDFLRPSLRARYSIEGDYRSLSLGGDVRAELFEKTTVLGLGYEHMFDDIEQRGRPGFFEESGTDMFTFGATQLLRPDLVVGASYELQIQSGYLENPYRVEQHPRDRARHAFTLFGAYRYDPTRTTLRLDYRLYADDWDLIGHTVGVEITQRVVPGFEVAPRFRIHTQGDVFFTRLADCEAFFPDEPGARCFTQDPKLFAFGSRLYGLKLIFSASFFEATPFEIFARSTFEPSYAYLDQDNSYGPAHIAQLGWYWPF